MHNGEIRRAFARKILLHTRSAFFIAAAAAFSPRRRQVPVFIRTPVRFSSPRSGGSLEPGLSRRRKASASSYSKPGALSKAKLSPAAHFVACRISLSSLRRQSSAWCLLRFSRLLRASSPAPRANHSSSASSESSHPAGGAERMVTFEALPGMLFTCAYAAMPAFYLRRE